jgi:hypothetical protein
MQGSGYGHDLGTGRLVEVGQILVEWDPYTLSILTEEPGTVKFKDVLEGVTVHEEVDEVTGLSRFIIVDSPDEKKQPTIEIKDKAGKTVRKYHMPVHAHLMVQDGETVEAGDVLAKIPRETTKTKVGRRERTRPWLTMCPRCVRDSPVGAGFLVRRSLWRRRKPARSLVGRVSRPADATLESLGRQGGNSTRERVSHCEAILRITWRGGFKCAKLSWLSFCYSRSSHAPCLLRTHQQSIPSTGRMVHGSQWLRPPGMPPAPRSRACFNQRWLERPPASPCRRPSRNACLCGLDSRQDKSEA